MLDKVIKIYKKLGETPLDCINNLKKDNQNLKFLPMTYAGRLDPLAEGVLLVLVGDECLEKDKYLALSKEYEVEILFGFATDTYDVLGKITRFGILLPNLFERFSDNEKISKKLNNSFALNEDIESFVGRIHQSYPPYSSRTVGGKPLYQWAREGRLDEIDIPSHDVFVENIDIIENTFIKGGDLSKQIKEKIGKVKGDFRQEEIIDIWEDKLKDKNEERYPILKLRISCGSGVYVRGIADELGKKLGIPALAFSIKRTKIGEYKI